MSNRYNIPDELVETATEDFKLVFDQDPDPERLAALIHHFGIRTVQQVLESLFIKGIRPLLEGKRNNPMGYLYISCQNFNPNSLR